MNLNYFVQVNRAILFFTLCLTATLVSCSSAFAHVPVVENDLLQFTANGHVLGFKENGLYVAGVDHMVKIDFVGTHGVIPVQAVSLEGKTDDDAISKLFNQVAYINLWQGIDLMYESASVAWQEIEGEKYPVEAASHLLEDSSGQQFLGFRVGAYDTSKPLLTNLNPGELQHISAKIYSK